MLGFNNSCQNRIEELEAESQRLIGAMDAEDKACLEKRLRLCSICRYGIKSNNKYKTRYGAVTVEEHVYYCALNPGCESFVPREGA